jgi:hypothetical protein
MPAMSDARTAMMSRTRVIGLWAWFGVATMTILAVVTANGGNSPRTDSVDVAVVVFWLLTPLYALLGVLIALKRPGNRIAWLFLFVSAGLCVEAAADSYLPAVRPDPAGFLDIVAAQWSNIGFWVVIVLPIALLLHVFPDGRVLGPRWAWVRWAAGLAVTAVLVSTVLSEEVTPAYTGADWVVDNPVGITGISGLEYLPAGIAFGVGMWSLMIGGVISMVKRFRRATDVVRAQIKWVGFAITVFALSTVFGLSLLGDYAIALVAISALFVPISVALAITRFRLYDIDRIVSRTVTYAVVIGILVGLFATVVTFPTLVVGAGSDPPAWLVASTTLAVAALFNPLRHRVQRFVDRRFNRARYDAQTVVERFSERVRDETDLGAVTAGLGEVAARVFQPEGVGIWVRERA